MALHPEPTSHVHPPSPPAIGLLGAGRMGRSIALVFAFGGHQATLIDIKDRTAADFASLQEAAWEEINAGVTILIQGQGFYDYPGADANALPHD